MTTFDSVVREIEHAPESVLQEVLDFVRSVNGQLAHKRFDAVAEACGRHG